MGGISVSGISQTSDLKLFVLYLNGTAVDHRRSYEILLGSGTGGKRAWHQLLPDGRILVAAARGPSPLSTGPMAGHLLAIIDTSGNRPAFSLLPNPTVPAGNVGGLAVDVTGTHLYFVHATTPPANAVGTLFELDLQTNLVCTLASWPGEAAYGVESDDDGAIYVSSTDLTTFQHFVHTVRGPGCSTAAVATTQSSQSLLAWGLALDRASGMLLATSGATTAAYAGIQNSLSMVDPVTGNVALTWSPPASGWGRIGLQGIAVNNRIESYGPASDGLNHYWFDNFPNPGSQPTVGNTTFSLTIASAPGVAQLSMLLLSPSRGSVQLSGVEVLVDPASLITAQVSASSPATCSLPIPNDPSLAGLVMNAQSLHLEANGGIAASRGLTLTVQ